MKIQKFFFNAAIAKLTFCIIVSSIFCNCTNDKKSDKIHINLIPTPDEMTQQVGTFVPNAETVITIPENTPEYEALAQLLNDNIQTYTGTPLCVETDHSAKNAINFEITDQLPGTTSDEAYFLTVNKKGVTIKASSNTGLFYGLQSILQLIDIRGIPHIEINDSPRFRYRGLHLDVSRHFFRKDFVLKLLDLMSYYKLNTFHWHLTDAGGWRIQIDQYPELTHKSAFRTKEGWREWWDGGDRRYVPEGTEDSYGGYYTKEDIREVVAYAQKKHITIIPEIEMPGHSEEIFAAYPQLCCSGKSGTSGDYCIGNDSAFTFIENVLTEVMELFPSEYIHIGGDEAGKSAWKTCPKCKARMQSEGLANVDELQSYMIHRIEKFVNSKGRKIIGWDEILEGGLAPDATVMSWRGEDGGIKAARAGHDVVMTPGNYMYFDFYQADPITQPYAIGGYTPIKKVYSYNPVSDSLTTDEAKHILGVQANLWTEYIPNSQHAEYMIFPRMLALAEIAWSPQEKRDWQTFKPRMNAQVKLLQSMDVNTFPLSYEIEATMDMDTINREIHVFLDAEKYPAEIRYTTNGTTPTAESPLYDSLITVKDSAHIVAAIFEKGELKGEPTEKKVDYHRGIGKKITFNSRLYSGYMAGGEQAIVDGYRGGLTYLDGRWQGYLNDLDAVVDMGEQTTINKLSSRFMQLTGPGVYQPLEVEYLISDDGKQFKSCGTISTTVSPDNSNLAFEEYTLTGSWKARYIQIKAKKQKGFIFIDEFVIW